MSKSNQARSHRRASTLCGSVVALSMLVMAACGQKAQPSDPEKSTPMPPATQPNPTSDAERTALKFVDELARGEVAHPATRFDSAMTEAMGPEKLREMWSTLEGLAGKFTSVDATHLQTKDGYNVVLVTCRFERIRKTLRVVLDDKGQVAGLFHGPVNEDLEAATRRLISAAAKGDFNGASADFGPDMRTGLPEAKFRETWGAVEGKTGKLVSVDRVELKPESGYWSMYATTKLEKDSLVVKVVFDNKNQVSGLFFQPATPQASWTAPSYVKSSAFTEQAVKVGVSPALPGTLSIPVGAGPFPAVVLVHGSGPSDQDESIGGVKVFKDIAQGLASQGVAVVRYEKRTLHNPAGVVTAKEEVIDAARDAIALLKQTARVDGTKIYLVGHSQGGYLAPRIAQENPGLAGVVVLSGNTRPLEDLIIDQLSYFASLTPGMTSLERSVVAARKFKDEVNAPTLKPETDLVMPIGAGIHLKGAYFLDTRGYDPASVAKGLSCRLLIVQGERDYQVTNKDFQGWKDKLSSQPNATLRSYPALNHLLVAGEGRSTPSEYETPAHVDESLVRDMATWLKGQTLQAP